MNRDGAPGGGHFSSIDQLALCENSASGVVVRVVGLEPTLLAEPDFESGASTNSTTPARRYL